MYNCIQELTTVMTAGAAMCVLAVGAYCEIELCVGVGLAAGAAAPLQHQLQQLEVQLSQLHSLSTQRRPSCLHQPQTLVSGQSLHDWLTIAINSRQSTMFS